MAKGKKQSFVLYHDIRGPLELLSDEDRGKLFLAILDYSEKGLVPEFDGALAMSFAFIKTAIDRDAEAWADKCEKRAVAGSLGGKQTQAKRANATFAKQNKQTQANQAVPVPVPAPVIVPDNEYIGDKPPTHSRFTPPTVEEVRAYCLEKGYSMDADAFVDHFTANGWKVGGKAPMRDWRASVRSWERREQQSRTRTQGDSETVERRRLPSW